METPGHELNPSMSLADVEPGIREGASNMASRVKGRAGLRVVLRPASAIPMLLIAARPFVNFLRHDEMNRSTGRWWSRYSLRSEKPPQRSDSYASGIVAAAAQAGNGSDALHEREYG